MELKIKLQIANGVYCAQIYVNGKWFKEVSGGSDVLDALNVISDSLNRDEDFNINPQT